AGGGAVGGPELRAVGGVGGGEVEQAAHGHRRHPRRNRRAEVQPRQGRRWRGARQDGDGRRAGGAGVIGGIAGREGHRQRLLRRDRQDGAGGRRISEGARGVGGGVELGRGQGRAVDDARRAGPGDRRRRPRHHDGRGGGRGLIVGGVGGGEGHR